MIKNLSVVSVFVYLMFFLSIDINGLTVSSDTNGVDLYLKGLEYEESGDYKNAREMFQSAIHHGDSYYAPLKLGQYYLIGVTGDKFSQNVEEAKIEGAKLVLQAAEKGNPWAMNLAAYLYTIGEGVLKNQTKAKEWILLSANNCNNPLAKYMVGAYFIPTDEDSNVSLLMVFQSAAEGLDEAQSLLLDVDSNSNPAREIVYTEEDIANSIVTRLYNESHHPNESSTYLSDSKSYLQKVIHPIGKGIIKIDPSARLDYAIEAMISLYRFYFEGEYTEVNKEEGIKWLEKACNLGDAQAQTLLATYLFFDTDNKDEGLKWYLKAAGNNYLSAMITLGFIYSEEKYGVQDLKQGFYWLNKASEAGDPLSMMRISIMYLKGEGVNQDDSEAFNWMNKAANLRCSEAIARLGNYYGDGIGVKKNKKMQVECYKKASEEGNLFGTYLLGRLYINEGEYQDKSEGFRLIKQVAQKNDPMSQAHLSLLYQYGIGCDKNLHEAERWANKAVENNCSFGYLALGNLYSQGGKKDSAKALKYIDEGIELFNNERNQGDWFDAGGLVFLDVKGKIYLRDNKLDKAREIAEEIIKIDPDYKDTEDNSLMDFYFNRKQGENGYHQSIICDVDIEIPESNIKNDKTFAVIIGNENYQEAVNVEFANNDAQSFANYCEKVLGLPKTHIRVYNDATYGKMINALSDIKAIAKAHNGDINIIFYYAGHGIPNEKDFSSYLLPVDADGLSTNLCLSLSHLYDSLSETNANRILVLLDACFSGATRSSGMLTAARGVAIKAQPEAPRNNMVIISAASGNETAYPYKDQGHGLFTYYLLKKLQQTKGNVTLSDLSNYITDNVKKQSVILNRKPQTPTVSGSVDLNTNWFNSK